MPRPKRYTGLSKRSKQRRARQQKLKLLASQIDPQQILSQYRDKINVHQNQQTNQSSSIINDNYHIHLINDNSVLNLEPLDSPVENLSDIDDFNQNHILDEIKITDSETTHSSIDDNNKSQPTEDLICASLLSTFFSANLTQQALKTVIELTQLFTGIEIPKSFNQLMLRISDAN